MSVLSCVGPVPTQRVDERKWGETSRKDQGSHAECSSRVPVYRLHPAVDRGAEQPADPRPPVQWPLGCVYTESGCQKLKIKLRNNSHAECSSRVPVHRHHPRVHRRAEQPAGPRAQGQCPLGYSCVCLVCVQVNTTKSEMRITCAQDRCPRLCRCRS